MNRSGKHLLAITVLAGSLSGCRRAPAAAPVPLQPAEGHCWWAVFQSPLPPDSVAVHFQRAFAGLGLTGSAWTHRADTAWAHAGPTQLDSTRGGATYSARVVAYRHGDSTHFRHFVTSIRTITDTINLGSRHIGFCMDIGRLANVHATAPREPTGEEKLPLWARQP